MGEKDRGKTRFRTKPAAEGQAEGRPGGGGVSGRRHVHQTRRLFGLRPLFRPKDPSNNYMPVAQNPLPVGNHIYDWTDQAATQVLLEDGTDAGIPGGVGVPMHEVVRSDQYQLYVMYLPAGHDRQWVPLQVMSW